MDSVSDGDGASTAECTASDTFTTHGAVSSGGLPVAATYPCLKMSIEDSEIRIGELDEDVCGASVTDALGLLGSDRVMKYAGL